MQIILADDEARVRSALKLLLQTRAGISAVGEVDNSDDLVARVQLTHANLVFLDWELPGLEPRDLLLTLRSLDPDLIVIALSGQPEARTAALSAGVDAFISKGDPPEQILRALQIVEDRN